MEALGGRQMGRCRVSVAITGAPWAGSCGCGRHASGISARRALPHNQEARRGCAMLIGLHICFSIIVGLLAIGRQGGFFLFFLLSLALTPVVGLIILLIATPVVVDVDGNSVKPRKSV
jgi:hypothetical protein